jgi:hypothetical protein
MNSAEAASSIVSDFLGPDWPDRVKAETDTQLRSDFRLNHLAHSCKAFESSVGFDEFIEKLRSRRVLQAVSEFFAAGSFHQAGFEVEFNHGTKRGEDYDLLAKSPHFSVAVEVKTAGLESEPRLDFLQTLKNRVKEAPSQLPKGGVNAVFVLVPEDVIAVESVAWAVKRAIVDDALRQTTRIHAVAFGCERIDHDTQRYGLSNTAFPHTGSNDVHLGKQIAYLLRRVPTQRVGLDFGVMQRLNLREEMQRMPRF